MVVIRKNDRQLQLKKEGTEPSRLTVLTSLKDHTFRWPWDSHFKLVSRSVCFREIALHDPPQSTQKYSSNEHGSLDFPVKLVGVEEVLWCTL